MGLPQHGALEEDVSGIDAKMNILHVPEPVERCADYQVQNIG